MNKKRPINLELSTLKYPPMAIASILHRISGVGLFLLLPPLMYLFHLSLKSEQSFIDLQLMLTRPGYKLLLWAFTSALIFHLLAGIRHLSMDIGMGEQLRAARYSALLVMISSIVLVVLLGIWIW